MADPARQLIADPWLLASPEAEHAGCYLALTMPSRRMPLARTRHLHGALSHAYDGAHGDRVGAWSLVPSPDGIGWGVLFLRRETAERLRGTSHPTKLRECGEALTFSPTLHAMRAPASMRHGRYVVGVDTVTPVVWTSMGRTTACERPTAQTFVASLGRVALALGLVVTERDVAVARVESEMRREAVRVGGKIARGPVRGEVHALAGRCIVECNAVAAWLLACSAIVGLGGSTTMGFGRVRVQVGRVT